MSSFGKHCFNVLAQKKHLFKDFFPGNPLFDLLKVLINVYCLEKNGHPSDIPIFHLFELQFVEETISQQTLCIWLETSEIDKLLAECFSNSNNEFCMEEFIGFLCIFMKNQYLFPDFNECGLHPFVEKTEIILVCKKYIEFLQLK
eukprot:TRINITY_DN11881_c0_g1_i1.p1 TRINITY_DN11881_c0_g1~~TRINITY_DN11881_c0_g1_i1.p1  ORF type:complete len:153 (-),score=38.57 TRINITY_DN11881_c0_g1_i1:132-566(-)